MDLHFIFNYPVYSRDQEGSATSTLIATVDNKTYKVHVTYLKSAMYSYSDIKTLLVKELSRQIYNYILERALTI